MLVLFAAAGCAGMRPSPTKQRSLDEWRELTSVTALSPRVFAKGDVIRFYFPTATNVVLFDAHWSKIRGPSKGYKVDFAMLRLEEKLKRMPEGQHGWHEATVIAGAEWRRLATNLLEALTPTTPGRAVYYQGFLADRLLYRDQQGALRSAAVGDQRKDVVIERRYSIEETLQIMARLVEGHLAKDHPGNSLFVLLAPVASRFPQPLLLDLKQKRCVWLLPAPMYDSAERGLDLSMTAQGLGAFVFESHGLALIKNPVSSAARLADLAVQTLVRFIRVPPLKPGSEYPPLNHTNGMDLVRWEKWLDDYTGTRREEGSLHLLINGEQFFPRLREAIAEATNHVHMDVYIFDRDDVGVEVADQLKDRSGQVKVKVILDRMGSIMAAAIPPGTPLPENFVSPSSITSYLKRNSRVEVRPFLNPWFSSDHSKVFLVDGTHAWIGGMNLGREYRYEWHDLMVEVQGPVVDSLEDEFRRDWAHAGLLGDAAYLAALATTTQRSEAPATTNHWAEVRLLPTKTAWKPFSASVQGAIRKSQSYVYAENSYLFDKRVIIGLVQARNRGVDVRVVLPRVNDAKAGRRSNLVTANYLLQHGVRVYFYPGMTHVKAFLADGWACLGSANLNHLSLRLCQERNLATSDPDFAAHLKHDLFEEDFARSYELTSPITVDWVDFLADLVLEGF